MKTIKDQVKEIRYCAECAIHSMKNHTLTYRNHADAFENEITSMHIAQNKDMLSKAYYNYIITAIKNGYSNGEIIAGIIQNKEQNDKFNVNIDSIIESLIRIKSPINLSNTIDTAEPKITPEQCNAESVIRPNDSIEAKQPIIEPNNVKSEQVKENTPQVVDNSAGGDKVDSTIINKIKGKINYANNLMKSEDINNTIEKAKSVCEEVKQMILAIDPTTCSEDEIAELNDASAAIDKILKTNNSVETKQVEIATESIPVQQVAAAHTEGGFNIGNFIKQNQQPVKGPNMPMANPNMKPNNQIRKNVFPHEICGLTDDQITEEIKRHFKVIESLHVYPLYDLLNNKLLREKMKEFNAKQRPNNPFLTQVNINEYIDIPELLAKYTLCFTIPCNDKDKIIVVLFNPTPVQDNNGVLNYPLHILKATKINKNKK